jgi:hypothetical protein
VGGGLRSKPLSEANIHTYWPKAQWARLDYLVQNARQVHVVNDTTKVTAKGYHARNTALVDHGDVVLSQWDGRGHGGTYNCINQANEKGVPVFEAGTLKQIGIHSPHRVGKYPHLAIP